MLVQSDKERDVERGRVQSQEEEQVCLDGRHLFSLTNSCVSCVAPVLLLLSLTHLSSGVNILTAFRPLEKSRET